jgi:hypothetical protein
MNFAENKKWPTSARWQGGVVDGVGGYVRRGSVERHSGQLGCAGSALVH